MYLLRHNGKIIYSFIAKSFYSQTYFNFIFFLDFCEQITLLDSWSSKWHPTSLVTMVVWHQVTHVTENAPWSINQWPFVDLTTGNLLHVKWHKECFNVQRFPYFFHNFVREYQQIISLTLNMQTFKKYTTFHYLIQKYLMLTGWHANIYELGGMTGNAKAKLSSNETFLRFHFGKKK